MSKRAPNFKKRKNDEYFTPVKPMNAILPHLKDGTRFIEPCAGAGAMVDFFCEKGHICVDAFDLEPSRKDIKQYNAFDYPISNYNDCDVILTNPPWTRTRQSGYLMHSLIDLWAGIKPTILLFDADWSHTIQAKPMLKYCTHIISVGRVSWMGNGVSGMDNCAWYIFDKDKMDCDTIFIGR